MGRGPGCGTGISVELGTDALRWGRSSAGSKDSAGLRALCHPRCVRREGTRTPVVLILRLHHTDKGFVWGFFQRKMRLVGSS